MKIKKIDGINYSSKIDIENKFYIKINNPFKNIQKDESDFEAIIIALKCKNPEAKFEIQFDENHVKWNGEFNTTTQDLNAYLRFLYRVSRFQMAFPEWVNVSEKNKVLIEKFKYKLEEAKKNFKISNNVPKREASKWKENMNEEKDIETRFTHSKKGKKYLKEICLEAMPKINLTDKIYNQLPNGLFNIFNDEEPKDDRRIFPTGFFDIWAIDDEGNLCIFELKKDKGNEKLGIISELFFYSVYAKEFLCDKNILHKELKKRNFRGYEELYKAVKNNDIKNVKGIFLIGKGVYPQIKEMKKEILNLLNSNKLGIEFMFLEYDIQRIKAIQIEEE